jgi:hypothetical protein
MRVEVLGGVERRHASLRPKAENRFFMSVSEILEPLGLKPRPV